MAKTNRNTPFGLSLQADGENTDPDHTDRVSFVPLHQSGDIPEFLEHRRKQRTDTIARRATCIAALRDDADSIAIEIGECERLLKISATMALRLVLIRLRSIQRANAAQIAEHLGQLRTIAQRVAS